jgi:hypothetical protein
MFMENQQQQDLTPEEIAARKQEMLDFYNESMEYLEAQYKYEKLLADIDESRLRRASVQMQFANLMAAQMDNEQEQSEGKEKKLKTK